MHKRKRRVGRLMTGQIELFAAIIVVATTIVVGSVLFLIDSGISTYYKEKLQHVTAQGAAFAASYKGADRQAATLDFVQALCTTMNLHGSNLSVSTSTSSIKGQPAVVCKANGDFPLIPGVVFPAQIAMSGSSAALMKGATPQIVSLYIFGIGNTFMDLNAVATGSILGADNKVITAQSNSSPGSASTGTVFGFSNNNTGSGNVYGNFNNNTGSGTVFGSGNITSGSGDTFGFSNNNSTSNNISGASNSWN